MPAQKTIRDQTLIAVRKARGSERTRNTRYVAALEFPGGRKAVLRKGRTVPPVLQKARQQVRQEVGTAVNNGALPSNAASSGGTGTSNGIRGNVSNKRLGIKTQLQ